MKKKKKKVERNDVWVFRNGKIYCFLRFLLLLQYGKFRSYLRNLISNRHVLSVK